jgi:chaperonin cofactor prefoldin
MNDTQKKVMKLLVTRELSETKAQLNQGASQLRQRQEALALCERQEKSLRDKLAVLREIRNDLRGRGDA